MPFRVVSLGVAAAFACSPLMPLRGDAGVDGGNAGGSPSAGGGSVGGGSVGGGSVGGGSVGGARWTKEVLQVPAQVTGAAHVVACNTQVYALVAEQYALFRDGPFKVIGSFGTPVFRDLECSNSGAVSVKYGTMVGHCARGCSTTLDFDEIPFPRAVLCRSDGALTTVVPRDGGLASFEAQPDGGWALRRAWSGAAAAACVTHRATTYVASTGALHADGDPVDGPDTTSLGRPSASERWFDVGVDPVSGQPVALSLDGALARWTVGRWSVEASGAGEGVAVAVSSVDDVWVLGELGLRRRTTSGWVDVPLPADFVASSLTVAGRTLFVGGNDQNAKPAVHSLAF